MCTAAAAGDIAARHAGVRDRVLLTASIDRISWLQVRRVVWGMGCGCGCGVVDTSPNYRKTNPMQNSEEEAWVWVWGVGLQGWGAGHGCGVLAGDGIPVWEPLLQPAEG